MTFIPVKPNVDDYWDRTKHAALLHTDIADGMPAPYSYDNEPGRLLDQCIDTAFAVKAARSGKRATDEETERLAPNFVFTRLRGAVSANTPLAWAQFVAKDRPVHIHTYLREWCDQQGFKPRVWGTHAGTHFHQGPVTADMLCAYLPYKVNATTFLIKWEQKVPRPEQVIQDALLGKLAASERQLDLIRQCVDCSDVEEDREAFTLIKGATPGHPSFIAMHASAAEMAIILMQFLYHIPEERLQELRNHARGAVFGRQYLGVHTQQDNAGGMFVGAAIAKRELKAFAKMIPGMSVEADVNDHIDATV